MVFGFLTKKLSAAKAVLNPAQIPLPPSPLPGNSSLTSLHEVPEASSSSVRQLRTPSPSIDSVAPGPSSSYAASTRQLSEPSFLVTPIEPQLIQPALLPTAESLTTLIKVVPPKTLRDYVVERLPSASTATLESLCDFFNTLSPPPRLHCVRCHKDFVEVENDDRSCTVAHDDDSAEVERVGRTGEARKTKEGTEYETLWGCCGKITEGDGSQGPPDGWCYEGKHTTDIKRARFRVDSTPQDDKLVPCLRLNCHGIRSRIPRPSRKRGRPAKNLKEVTTDEDHSDGASDSGMEEITGKKTTSVRRKTTVKGKGKGKEKLSNEGGEEDDKMDVDQDVVDGSSVVSPDKSELANSSIGTPTPKRRGRPPKSKAQTPSNTTDVEQGTSSRRRGRPPKSKATIEDSDAELSTATRGRRANANTESPTRSRQDDGKPKTRSLSRGRQPAAGSPSTTTRGKSAKRTKTRMNEVLTGNQAGGEVDASEDGPKKRRKVAS